MKNNSEKSLILSLTGDLLKAPKYEIYKNNLGELFIIESKDLKKSDKTKQAMDIYEDALLDVMSIGQSLPFHPYEEWTEEEKKLGANYAVYFCNKYGLLGMEEILSRYTSVYRPRMLIEESTWYPVEGELEKVKKESEVYIENFDNWGSIMFDFLSEMAPDSDRINKLYHLFRDKYLPVDFSNRDIEDIKWLFDFSKRFSSLDEPLYPKNEISKGEPVKMIVDNIWYLYRYARIWDFYRNNDVNIDDIYNPIECDNHARLLKDFSYSFGYNAKGFCWPTWGGVLQNFVTDSFRNTNIKYGMSKKNNNEWEYNIEFPTLFETLSHFLLLEIDSENRVIRFCKNCGEILLDDNKQMQYCSVQCRNQYNVRMYRKRKAESKKEI